MPTWYESIALLVCAILLAVIAFAKKRGNDKYQFHWSVLSIFFLYLSIDEAAQIHELFNVFLFSFSSYRIFHFPWVIIGIPIVIIFIITYMKFLINLPKNIRFLFILAGIFFVGGSLGMELVGGWYEFANGKENLIYAMISTIEESLEMIGTAFFVYALTYISLYFKEEVVFSFQERDFDLIKT
ncbi:Uncharacterised protein [uncultured archaeon]|nr:Uncharacterised protein [uncultured archaeon]